MEGTEACGSARYTTSQVAARAGCSPQQVRDLERLGVIPAARRQPNGYRCFGAGHLRALKAYRQLAIAVGPVVARAVMRDMRVLPHDEAIARIIALHVGLNRAREETLAALHALDGIVAERSDGTVATPDDSMGITQLASALGVRSSTLRFWEREGLIASERTGRINARIYAGEAIGEARIVAALRAGGYGIPAVRSVLESLRGAAAGGDARRALEARLRGIATRSEALLRAGAGIADLLASPAAPRDRPGT